MSPDIMQPRQHTAAGGGVACGKRRAAYRAAPCAVAGAQRRKGRGLVRREGCSQQRLNLSKRVFLLTPAVVYNTFFKFSNAEVPQVEKFSEHPGH